MLNVKLTIDYNIQKTAEEVMDKYNLKGAVVIEEVSSGDIVAMVSKPDFNPNEIEKYLDSPDNELFNRAWHPTILVPYSKLSTWHVPTAKT